jgi:uncharacterized protein (TIGR03437 family)
LYKFRFPIVVAAVFAGLLLAGTAPAQTVSVVAGNGQFICPTCQALTGNFQAVKVLVTDAGGNPIPNATVNWSTNAFSTQAVLSASTTLTASDGTATNTLFALSQLGVISSQSYLQYTVTATSGGSTATFSLTQGFDISLNGVILQAANVSFLTAPIGLSGAAGSTADTPVQVLISDRSGQGIPNVSVFLATLPDATGPTMQCKSGAGAGVGTVLTDATGRATCQPVFGPVPGTAQFQINVGGAYPSADFTQTPTSYRHSNPYSFTTTPGLPGSVVVTQGNGQSVNPGQNLPTALGVQVRDASGNSLAGQSLLWSVSPAGSASLFNTATTTDSNGMATTGVAVSGGFAAGTITVTAKAAADQTKSATFTITVVPVITITGFTIVSGNNQSAPVNTAFGSPLVVQVTTSAGTAANIPVQFRVASGSVSLNATNVSTDANGQAQVTATAGSVTGAATVTATVTSNTGVGSQTFSLTVLPPAPAITASNFVNGADASQNTLSPCSIGALVGSQAALGVSGLVPTFPGVPVNTSIRITLSNISAPILSIGTLASGMEQIQFQVPCEVAPGSVPVTVNLGGGTTNLTLTIQEASPGVYQTMMSDNVLRAVLVRPDGSFVSVANPARRGETEVAYVTGLGPTSPLVGTSGVPAPSASATVQGTVIAGMNGQGVPVVSAKAAEDLPGVFVVAFEIPSDMATGDVTFSVGVVPPGGSSAINSNSVKVPVQ